MECEDIEFRVVGGQAVSFAAETTGGSSASGPPASHRRCAPTDARTAASTASAKKRHATGYLQSPVPINQRPNSAVQMMAATALVQAHACTQPRWRRWLLGPPLLPSGASCSPPFPLFPPWNERALSNVLNGGYFGTFTAPNWRRCRTPPSRRIRPLVFDITCAGG